MAINPGMTKVNHATLAGTVALLLTGGCGDGHDPMGELDTTDGSSSTTAEASESSGEPEGSTGVDGSTDDGSTTSDDVCGHGEIGAVVPVGEGCCGCLCGETGWSCSQDTCLQADGTAAGLAPEAGFFEIESYEYEWHGSNQMSARSRVWYSFWPADDEPESRPLVLLFNGGPGAATGLLFGSSTAPFTLDPQLTETVGRTAAPWTEAFNLLYVDAPSTGFSYSLPPPSGHFIPVGIDPDQEASVFISVLLRFLARHPEIQHQPVVILGESYGGTRGMLMLEQLLDYETLVDGASIYQNPSVHAEIERHLASLYPETCGLGITREQVAAQFGHFVVVQGLVAGFPQLTLPGTESPLCLVGGDPYHCDEPDGWLFDVIAEIGDRLRQPDVLQTVLGVDPTTIAWMHADARVGAYGREVMADESAMISVFGALEPGDAYYVEHNDAVMVPQLGTRDFWAEEMADVFLRTVATVETFMTDARLDNAIRTYLLPPLLEARAEAVVSAVHDEAPRPGVDRAGWFRIEYAPGWAPDGVATRELRVPRYDEAGHTVTLDDPELLLEDLVAWWEGSRRGDRGRVARPGALAGGRRVP